MSRNLATQKYKLWRKLFQKNYKMVRKSEEKNIIVFLIKGFLLIISMTKLVKISIQREGEKKEQKDVNYQRQ